MRLHAKIKWKTNIKNLLKKIMKMVDVEQENMAYGGEETLSGGGSSSDHLGLNKTKYPKFRVKTNMVDLTFIVGMLLKILIFIFFLSNCC